MPEDTEILQQPEESSVEEKVNWLVERVNLLMQKAVSIEAFQQLSQDVLSVQQQLITIQRRLLVPPPDPNFK